MGSKFFYLMFLALFCIAPSLSAQITVHFTNPWPDEPERADSLKVVYYTSAIGVNQYPAVSEGSGMYSHIFAGQSNTSDLTFNIESYSRSANSKIKILNLQEIFSNDEKATDVYLHYITQDSEPQISFNPLNSKVIYLLNPWPQNSPKAVVQGNTYTVQMVTHELKEQDDNFCGWYSFFYIGDVSKCVLHFVNYPETQKYLTGGIDSGDDYDLSSYLKDHDTVWISPNPYTSGPGVISNTYPNKRGDNGIRKISAHIRDFKYDGVSFFSGEKRDQNVVKGIVQSQLGSDGKPVKSAKTPAGATGVETVNEWFKDSGTRDTSVQLKLLKQYNGNWVFNSDKDGGFFPIDSFNVYKETYGYDSVLHNYHFTMDIHLKFVYQRNTSQHFILRSGDDSWAFVNGKLAIDLGNLHWAGHETSADTLFLDQSAAELGLIDNDSCSLDIFYASRQPPGSCFNINLPVGSFSTEQPVNVQKTLPNSKSFSQQQNFTIAYRNGFIDISSKIPDMYQIELFNLSGKKIFSIPNQRRVSTGNDFKMRIPATNIIAGVYIVNLKVKNAKGNTVVFTKHVQISH